jgi:branched-chain amino acid transport system permease protein
MLILQELVNGVLGTSTIGLVAYSISLVYGGSRMLDIGLGAAMTLAGLLIVELCVKHSVNLVVGIVVAIVMGAILSAILYRFIYRPILAGSGTTVTAVLAGIVVLLIAANLASLAFNGLPYSLNPEIFGGLIRVAGLVIPTVAILGLVVAILAFLAVELLLAFTNFGRSYRALADNAELALLAGVNSRLITTCTFAIGGGLAALAACFSAFLSSVEAFNSEELVLVAAAAVIVGGLTSRIGAVLGALVISLAQSVSIVWISATWQDAVAFTLLTLVIIVRPRGVFGWGS